MGLLQIVWKVFAVFSDLREHAGKDLKAQVLLITQAVGAALKDADFVVETLDEAEGDLVVGTAIGGDAVPVTIDHRRELLVRLEPSPFKCLLPVLEKAPCPGLAPVVPQLPERFLEQIGDVEPVVGLQQFVKGTAAFQGEIVAVRQQGVLLALDDAAILAAQPGVLALSHLVQSLAEMAHDVELVEQNAGLRSVPAGGVAKGLPHVHHRQPHALAFRGSQPLVEEIHARFGAVPTAEPDRSVPPQIADHDAVGVPLADRDLVDAERPRRWGPRSSELLLHVLLVEILDGLPVQVQLAGDVPDRRGPTAPAHEERKALGVKGVVGKPGQLLLLHLGATPAAHPTALELQIDSGVSRREVSHLAQLAIVDSARGPTTGSAQSFFPRRSSRTMRTLGSPNTPRTAARGRNAGKRYTSTNRRALPIANSCQVFRHQKTPQSHVREGFQHLYVDNSSTRSGEEPVFFKITLRKV